MLFADPSDPSQEPFGDQTSEQNSIRWDYYATGGPIRHAQVRTALITGGARRRLFREDRRLYQHHTYFIWIHY